MPADRKSVPKYKRAPKRDTGGRTYKKMYKQTRARYDVNMTNYMRLITDPFSEKVRPTSLPDMYSQKSVPLILRGSMSITVPTTGNFAVQFTPNLANHFRVATFNGDNIPVFPNTLTAHPQYAALADSLKYVKHINLATKLEYTGRADQKQGVFSSLIATDTPTDLALEDYGSLAGGESVTQPVGNSALVSVSRLFDKPDFVPQTSNVEDKMANIVLGGAGLTSASSVRISYMLSIEVISTIGSALSHSEFPSKSSDSFNTNVPSSHHNESSHEIVNYIAPPASRKRSRAEQ